MALSPAKLARIKALVQLAGSPYEEEARTAAFQACKLMREENVEPSDVIGMLPASPYAAAPAPTARPVREPEDDPSWSMRRLSNHDLEEQHRMLGAVHNMTAAQLAAARRRLAQEQQRRAEEEARAEALAEQLARKNRILADIRRNNAAPRPAQGPILPTGAGRREPWLDRQRRGDPVHVVVEPQPLPGALAVHEPEDPRPRPARARPAHDERGRVHAARRGMRHPAAGAAVDRLRSVLLLGHARVLALPRLSAGRIARHLLIPDPVRPVRRPDLAIKRPGSYRTVTDRPRSQAPAAHETPPAPRDPRARLGRLRQPVSHRDFRHGDPFRFSDDAGSSVIGSTCFAPSSEGGDTMSYLRTFVSSDRTTRNQVGPSSSQSSPEGKSQ